MRSILLTTLFFLSFATLTKAQTNVYYSFASDSKWSEATYLICNTICSNGGVTSTNDEGFYYRLTNDTLIINGKAYRQLNYASTWSFYEIDNDTMRDLNYGPPFSESIYGAIREDSLHRIYFRNLDTANHQYPYDSDYLMYDFSLVTGDSANIKMYNESFEGYVVGYDSLLIGNSYRKVLLISEYDSTDFTDFPPFDGWCEGVGSLNGGLFETDMFTCEWCGFAPECFSVNDTTLLPPNFQGSCDTIAITSINTLTSQKPSLQIFPNPASDELFLKFSPNFIPKEITIYNSIGQQINLPFTTAINKGLDIENLPAGLYIIKATDDNSVLTEVFIKE